MKNRNAFIAIILIVALILGFAFGGQGTAESGAGATRHIASAA